MTTAYVVMRKSEQGPDVAVCVCWTKPSASAAVVNRLAWDPKANLYIAPTYTEPLANLVNAYFRLRGLVDPTLEQAFQFLVSEVGELANALVSDKEAWIRNHPDKEDPLEDEIGDVLMMLIKVAEKWWVDPLDAMLTKWRTKGWDR